MRILTRRNQMVVSTVRGSEFCCVLSAPLSTWTPDPADAVSLSSPPLIQRHYDRRGPSGRRQPPKKRLRLVFVVTSPVQAVATMLAPRRQAVKE